MAEATATKDRIDTDVKIDEIGPAARRLTITIPPEAVAEKLNTAMGTLATETALPGFRKGRAPRKLLERRFGTAVRQEAKSQLIADAYASAIEAHQIKPVGDPEPVEKLEELEVEEGKPLTFSVEVEVMPEFDLPEHEGIEVAKPVLEITDEHVQNEVERYRQQFGDVIRVDGQFSEGTRIVGRATATKKGETEPFFRHDQVVIVHPGTKDGGRGQVLGLLVENLGDLLEGRKVNDTITIETKGPEAHEREDIRGADLVVEFEIKHAERIEPAPVEAVVENLGLGTEQILLEQIRMVLEQRLADEQRAAMRRQVADQLLKAVDFELPRKLSEQQVTRTLERQRLEMLYQGVEPEQVETRLAEIRSESETQTRDRLKLFFLLKRLSDHFKVEVSQQEVNGRVAALATRRGMRPEQLMNELVQAGRLGEVTEQIREHKALDRVVDYARVSEVSAEEWQKLQDAAGSGPAPSSGKKKKTTKKKTTRKKTAAK